MAKFALGDRVIYAPASCSKEAEAAGTIARVIEPPAEGWEWCYDVWMDSDDLTGMRDLYREIKESELTLVTKEIRDA